MSDVFPSPSSMPTTVSPYFREGKRRQFWHRDIAIWMTPKETELFTSILLKNSDGSYLEFGCGGSTLLAAGIVRQVVSVENDAQYIKLMRRKFLTRPARSRPRFLHVDQGPLGDWGFPATKDPAILVQYAARAWQGSFVPKDVRTVLVDGRFRRACMLQAILHLDHKTDFVIHDSDRYQDLVPEFFVVTDCADTLQHLRVRTDIRLDDVRERLVEVQLNQE